MSAPPENLLLRFRRWVVVAIAVGAAIYLIGSIWAGFDQVGAALRRFHWLYAAPVILLTLLNYGLRFLKWHAFLNLLGVRMPLWENVANFTAGLAMVISPGKAGELLKPYVVRERTGTPMAHTIPALLGERITDAIAMLILAGISVSTYFADQVWVLLLIAGAIALGLLVVASHRLTELLLQIGARLPLVSRQVPKLREMVIATRTCLAPGPLLMAVTLSIIAWFAECLGLWLVFLGLDVDVSLDFSVFLYAFATLAGGAMPGGLGVTEGALAAGAIEIGHVDPNLAVAASLLIRVATLWLGVGLGAIALFRVSALLGGNIQLGPRGSEAGGSPP